MTVPRGKRKPAPARGTDEQLARYRAKRDFQITAEPPGEGKATPDQLPFVIQKHAATRLHYDFRLGWHGVLKSWAVTKGPSCVPSDKRLAVQVEDHPLEYGGFEGTIPKGQYGGGTVMVWDRGVWEPREDVDAGLAKGRLKFALRGKKLKGNWMLVRMSGSRSGKSNWLLIKERDQYACPANDQPITEVATKSVLTGRSMEEIAGDQDRSWTSNRTAIDRGKRRAKSVETVSKAPLARTREIKELATQIKLTNPDKQMDLSSKLTKAQLAIYYLSVAENLLPHIRQRPLSIVRCPEGTKGQCFFQKHLTRGHPRGFEGVEIKERRGTRRTYITISSAEGLLGLAQLGALEVHPWGSCVQTLEMPDRLTFDLDPGAGIEWKTLVQSALEVRSRLQSIGLKSFVKTTGGKGLHVVVPIRPEHPWRIVKEFTKLFASEMAASDSALYVTEMTKSKRDGRIYIDYLRNERGATAVAPYSPRARSGVPVAMPLAWEELKKVAPPRFTVSEFPEWKARLKNDPWQHMLTISQSLPRSALDLAA